MIKVRQKRIDEADFMVRREGEYRRVEFARRQRVSMGQWDVWVARPEDLILSKLAWSRTTASDLQRRDARHLAASAEGLDWDYLRSWASMLGVSALLEEVEPGD